MPFIIYGSRGLTSTVGNGRFICPDCMEPRDYTQKRVRTWFTLYFIPLIPGPSAGEYIECQVCRGTYTTDAIDYNPIAERREFFHKLMRALILLGVSDGALSDTEREALKGMMLALTNEPIDDQQISHEENLARSSGADFASYVRNLSPDLGDGAKDLLVRMVWELSVADQMTPNKQAQIEQLPTALGITRHQFQQIIDEMS